MIHHRFAFSFFGRRPGAFGQAVRVVMDDEMGLRGFVTVGAAKCRPPRVQDGFFTAFRMTKTPLSDGGRDFDTALVNA